MRREDLPAPITFGSVCSGIEAFSVAVAGRAWVLAWLAEIEPFPCKVLHHHYGSGRPVNMPSPDEDGLTDDDRDARRANIKSVASLPVDLVDGAPPNYGDFTLIAAQVRAGHAAAPDVLVGGTPCQAFSIAGLRNSLGDARGQLTLSFVDLANAIDSVRLVRGLPSTVILWENVPGVLSTKDNAFGCFLGALAGEDCPLVAPGGKWPNAGYIAGPQRTIAWRVTDAQYFGVAQRRRRVFVVASAGEGFDPAAVLFEFDGVRRDSPPSRESPQDIAGTVRASAARRGGVQDECGLGLQPVSTEDIGGARQVDGKDIAFGASVAAPVARSVERPRGDGLDTLIAGTLQANGKAAGSATQQDAEAGMLIPMAFGGNNQAGEIHVATACRAHAGPHLDFESETFLVQQVAYPIQNATRGKDQNGLGIGDAGAPMYTLDNGSQHGVALAPIAFSSKDYGGDASVDLSPTLRAGNHADSHANSGTPPGIAYMSDDYKNGTFEQCDTARTLTTSADRTRAAPIVCITGDITHTLKAEGFDASEDGTGRGQPIVAFQNRFRGDDGRGYSRAPAVSESVVGTLETVKQWNITAGMAVRRLMPRECERLQAFPDDYTLVPIREITARRAQALTDKGELTLCIDGQWWQLAADGPRYKALGNSMCVFNIRWIAARIEAAIFANFAHEREIARVV